MNRASKTSVYITNQSGKLSGVQHEIERRLKKRIPIRQVNSVDECDIIIAFVPVVSRAGTDIKAALDNIPKSKRVILVVLHQTIDEDYNAPQSKCCVNDENVLAVDFLYHEDTGLFQCLANDEALKSITDDLVSVGPDTPLLPVRPVPQRRCLLYVIFFIVLFLVIGLIVYGVLHQSEGHNDTLTTVQPNITTPLPNITTPLPNITTPLPNITTPLPNITNIS